VKREKFLPLAVFLGCALVIVSPYVGLLLNITVLGKSLKADTAVPPYGRELLEPLANLLTLVLLISGIVLIFFGLRKTEFRK